MGNADQLEEMGGVPHMLCCALVCVVVSVCPGGILSSPEKKMARFFGGDVTRNVGCSESVDLHMVRFLFVVSLPFLEQIERGVENHRKHPKSYHVLQLF